MADHDPLGALAALADPVRAALYEFVVAEHRYVARDEAADAVGVSVGLAAYHLDRLVDVGLLEVTFRRRGVRRGPGAGRPAKLYRRSSRELRVAVPPRDYELAARLLADALDGVDDGALRRVLHRRAQRAGRARRADAPAADLDELLQDCGYEPVRDKRGHVELRNCPFHALAQEHRELICAFVRGLVADSDYRARLDPDPERCCVVLDAR